MIAHHASGRKNEKIQSKEQRIRERGNRFGCTACAGTLVLHLSDEEPLPITLEAIDRLALIARYIEGADEE
jgi:hypothetical protein